MDHLKIRRGDRSQKYDANIRRNTNDDGFARDNTTRNLGDSSFFLAPLAYPSLEMTCFLSGSSLKTPPDWYLLPPYPVNPVF
ncbi:hypothetical protein JYT51_01020 [Candidatus Amoebophilus asiaticus]|nr:hypothetical protein [Candidatus Amoebophilus asiaticus]